jgi:uncharacterized protein with HEPN domain
MTRRDAERLSDILAAIDAIRAHLARGDLSDGLVYDAAAYARSVNTSTTR